MRCGFGYDIHKLVSGRKLIIGGETISHSKGLLGHTDADVLVHAIIDALLGAAALGSIGGHFPDTDPKWKDKNSLELLEAVFFAIKNKGYKIVNIDTTIVAEEPKLDKHTSQMVSNLARVLTIKENQVNVKAKTNEGQDSTGQKNAICAYAIALIE